MVCLFLTMAHKSQPILPELRFRRRSPYFTFFTILSPSSLFEFEITDQLLKLLSSTFCILTQMTWETISFKAYIEWLKGRWSTCHWPMKKILKRINNIFSIMLGHFDKFKQWLSLCVCKLPCLVHDYKSLGCYIRY